MPGVFSLNEGNIKIQNKVAELNGERDKLAVQYQEKKNALTDAKEKLPALRIALESSCWETTSDIRNRFAKALAGKRGKKSVFTDELLSISEPKEQDFNVLQSLYETAFDERAKSYPLLKKDVRIPLKNLWIRYYFPNLSSAVPILLLQNSYRR